MSPIDRSRLLVPALGSLYGPLSSLSLVLMRVCAGLILAVHGWPKIQAPMKAAGMVESLAFSPVRSGRRSSPSPSSSAV